MLQYYMNILISFNRHYLYDTVTRFGIRLDEDISEIPTKKKNTDAIEMHDKILRLT